MEVRASIIRPYYAGDTLIFVVGQRGKMKVQSVSHSPVGYGVESGFLDEAEAMYHEERHLISNFIGVPDMRIEIGPATKLATRDTLLIASDGLWDNLQTDEIIDVVRKGPLQGVAKMLASRCEERMTPG